MGIFERVRRFGIRNWPALLVITVGILIQVFLISRPIDFLLSNIITDDSFYYFDIARSVVEGTGASFNGIDPTNGFHPLWLVTILPIYEFLYTTASDLTPIRTLLGLSVLFNAITALVVLRIIGRFVEGRFARTVGMMTWMLNPYLLYETVNGLETALALMLFSIFFYNAILYQEGQMKRLWLLGLIGGFMCVARIDMVFYLGAFGLWVLFRDGLRQGFHKGLTLASFAAIPIAPWFLWNWLNFNMLLTSASSAYQMVNHELVYQDNGRSLFQFLKAIVYSTQNELLFLFARTGELSVVVGLIGAGCALAALRALPYPKRLRDITVTHALFGGFVLLFIADAGLRWTVRSWYFVSFNLFVAIGAAVIVGMLYRHISYRRSIGAVYVLVVLFSFFVHWHKYIDGQMVQQLHMYDTAFWINDNLPPQAVVGVFNSGVIGYFADRTIVNLDGLVNNSAYEAMRDRRLWDYIEKYPIDYVADFDIYMSYRYKSFFGDDPFAHMTLVHSVSRATVAAQSPDRVNVYEVQ